MQRWERLVLTLALCLLVVPAVLAQDEPAAREGSEINWDFVVQARPASLFIDTEGKKLDVNGTKLSTLYYMPNLDAGVGMAWKDIYADLTVGGGMFVNDRFRSFTLQVTAECAYSITDSFTLGPRVGMMSFLDPEWLENDDVDFDSDTGLLVGLQMSLGERISYIASVDWIDASIDINPAAGTTVSDNELDLAGLAFQFGIRGEF